MCAHVFSFFLLYSAHQHRGQKVDFLIASASGCLRLIWFKTESATCGFPCTPFNPGTMCVIEGITITTTYNYVQNYSYIYNYSQVATITDIITDVIIFAIVITASKIITDCNSTL